MSLWDFLPGPQLQEHAAFLSCSPCMPRGICDTLKTLVDCSFGIRATDARLITGAPEERSCPAGDRKKSEVQTEEDITLKTEEPPGKDQLAAPGEPGKASGTEISVLNLSWGVLVSSCRGSASQATSTHGKCCVPGQTTHIVLEGGERERGLSTVPAPALPQSWPHPGALSNTTAVCMKVKMKDGLPPIWPPPPVISSSSNQFCPRPEPPEVSFRSPVPMVLEEAGNKCNKFLTQLDIEPPPSVR
jgi:hypothetical protein